MKLSHKIMTVSAAALFLAAPAVSLSSNNDQVIAASKKAKKAKKTKTVKKTKKTKKSKAVKKTKAVKKSKKTILTLARNSYVYTKSGKRTKYQKAKTLRKGKRYAALSAKTITLKHVKYYRLATNAYIKAANVAKVNGKAVKKTEQFGTKVSVPKNADQYRATIKRNSYFYDNDLTTDKTDKLLKGSTIYVDLYGYIGVTKVYRVASGDYAGSFIKASNVSKIDGKGKRMQLANGKNTVLRYLSDNETLIVLRSDRPSNIYNEAGKLLHEQFSGGEDNAKRVDKAIYMVLSDDDKIVHLMYKIIGQDQYIRASDVVASYGKALKPENTDKSVSDQLAATSSDKESLQTLYNTEIAGTTKYQLAAKDKQTQYDAAFVEAGHVLANAKATVAEVKTAEKKLQTAINALDGSKVKVVDPDNLTAAEKSAVIQKVAAAYGVSESQVNLSTTSEVNITGTSSSTITLPLSDFVTSE